MDIAVNPTTGEAVQFDGHQWTPVPTAVNSETKETLIYDGQRWSPLPGAATPQHDATQAALQEEARQGLAAQGIRPAGLPGEIVERGAILPFGADAEGKVSFALPEFLEGPRRTIMDLLEGRRTVQEVSGKEIFELGALFSGASSASGTGAGIARASTVMADASRPAIPASAAASAAQQRAAPAAAAAAAAAPAATVAPAAAPVAAAAPAAVAAPARTAAAANVTGATPAEIKAASKTLYNVADEAELVLSNASFQPVVQAAQRDALKAGLDKDLTKDSVAALGRLLEAANKPVTFQDLITLREVVGIAAGSKTPKDARIASGMIDKIDDYIANLSAKDVFAGATDPQVAAKALKGAQELWSTQAKLQTIAGVVQRAQDRVVNRPSLGLENTLRTEFVNLMTNARQMARFTPQEQAAIRAVTRGPGKTTARAVGRLAPTGPVSGMFAGGATTVLGAKLGLDPFSAAVVLGPPVAGITFGARKLATVLTQRGVKSLEDIIKQGNIKSQTALNALARGRGLTNQLAGQTNTAIQAQAVQPQQPRP